MVHVVAHGVRQHLVRSAKQYDALKKHIHPRYKRDKSNFALPDAFDWDRDVVVVAQLRVQDPPQALSSSNAQVSGSVFRWKVWAHEPDRFPEGAASVILGAFTLPEGVEHVQVELADRMVVDSPLPRKDDLVMPVSRGVAFRVLYRVGTKPAAAARLTVHLDGYYVWLRTDRLAKGADKEVRGKISLRLLKRLRDSLYKHEASFKERGVMTYAIQLSAKDAPKPDGMADLLAYLAEVHGR